jgi:hypothetical protein
MLYKYFSLASKESRASFEALVRENKIWLSSFEKLNDPFESKPCITHDLNHKKVRDRLRKLLSAKISDIKDPVDLETALRLHGKPVSKINSSVTKEYVEKHLSPRTERDVSVLFANVGTGCFSRDGGSPAMWAYYANNHSGAVVQISSCPKQVSGQLVQEVTYLKSRPAVGLSQLVPQEDTTSFSWEVVKYFIATKAIEWEHEKEVRIIVRGKHEQYHYLPNNIRRSVIIGCRATDETRRFVETVASKEDIFQARLCDSEYRILWDRLA